MREGNFNFKLGLDSIGSENRLALGSISRTFSFLPLCVICIVRRVRRPSVSLRVYRWLLLLMTGCYQRWWWWLGAHTNSHLFTNALYQHNDVTRRYTITTTTLMRRGAFLLRLQEKITKEKINISVGNRELCKQKQWPFSLKILKNKNTLRNKNTHRITKVYIIRETDRQS